MMRLFITGGAGFIGSAFVRLALAEIPECKVTNFDALTYAGNPDNLERLDDRAHHFVHGNIADRAAVMAALDEGKHAVINFAPESHVDRSIALGGEFIKTDECGTHIVL